MKILYFYFLYDIQFSSAGAAAHVRHLTNALETLGCDIAAYNLDDYTTDNSVSDRNYFFRTLKLKIGRYLSQTNKIISNVKHFIKAYKIVREIRPEIIILRYHLLNISIPFVAKWFKIPLLLEVNSPMVYECKKYSDQIQLPVLPLFFEWINFKLSSKIYVVSEVLRQYYKNWLSIYPKLFVIPNGANISGDDQLTDRSHSPLNKIKKDNIIIGFIGTFHYWHGIDNLLFLINELSGHPNIYFCFIGDGPLKNKVVDNVLRMKMDRKIDLPGYVSIEDIPKYLNDMDILIAPYPPNDFFYYSPLKIFEYMGAGKAVVASNVGQIGNIISHQVDGLLYDPENIEELVGNIRYLISNESEIKRLAGNAREKIKNRYTWSHTAQKVYQLCLEITRKNSS